MDVKIFKQIGEKVIAAKKVLVLAHHQPDGDTLGSALAVKMWLDKIGKKVTLFCKDRPGKVFDFMPQVGNFVRRVRKGDFDLVLAVDLAGAEMSGFDVGKCPILNSGAFVVNIDHHASNDLFGDLNCVDANAASNTVLVYGLLRALGAEFDCDMATVLLTGIYTDTGSFTHSNTNNEAYAVAAELLAFGGKASGIVKAFKVHSVDSLRLWGKVFSNLELNDGVLVSMVKGEGSGLLSGVVDYLNMVPNVKFSLLLNEDRRGNVKASMRTRDEKVDLTALAREFGGGGHPKASGFMVERSSAIDVRERILSSNLSKNI